jgi:hypothetical protein
MTRPPRTLAATAMIAVVSALVVAWALAGVAAAVVVAVAEYAVALLALRARIPARPYPPSVRGGGAFPNSGFAGFRRIEHRLLWAPVSARHFDHGVRPQLLDLVADTFADRRRADIWGRGARLAESHLGEDLWPLVDPRRPASWDSDAPGVPLTAVSELLDRLEDL